MEAYGTQPSRHGTSYSSYQGTQTSRRQPVLIIDDSEEEVQGEAYKVNWKIAVPLLILGVIPGLIYLAGVAIANCLGGREVRREPQDYTSRRGLTPSYQQYQTVRGEPSRRSTRVADERTALRPDTSQRQGKSSRKDRSGETREVIHTKKERKSKRREESPSVVDRTVTRSPAQSAIPSQPRSQRKKDAARSSTRAAREPTPLRPSSRATPMTTTAQRREPTTHEEQIRENVRQGTAIISRAKISDKAEAQRAMEKMARMLPYNKDANPGSFQHWLSYAYPKA